MVNVHRIVAAGAAVSLIAALGFAQDRHERTVHLKSEHYRRASRSVDNRGVRLVRKRSDAPCVLGRSWGFNRNTIWVSRGCEGDFAYTPRRR